MSNSNHEKDFAGKQQILFGLSRLNIFVVNSSSYKNILLILLAAFVLRFIGIWYGLPSIYNFNESFSVLNALGFGAKLTLEPISFVYNTFYFYFLFGIFGIYLLFGKAFGVYETAHDLVTAYFLNPTGLFLVGRFVSVVLGVLTVWMAFKIGQRFFSKRIGLFSALILALSFTHTEVSHWILIEPGVAFMSALALYLILQFSEQPSMKMNILASVVGGLAISTKYNAAFVYLPLLLALVFIYKNNLGKLFANFGVSVIFIVLGFLVGTPYSIISFSSLVRDLEFTWLQAGAETGGAFRVISLVWPLWQLVLKDWTIGFLLVAGFIYGFFHREKKQILLLSFALPAILLAGLWNQTGIHYLLPVFSALSILAAIFLDDISEQIKRRNLRVAIVTLLFVVPVIKILYYDIRLVHPDTRNLAEDWIENTIPRGSTIGYENDFSSPNLFDPARFFKNPIKSQLISLELKEKLLIERRKRASYCLINFRKDLDPRLS
jgi:4-amino-4-deoxy-L-arabinose transferase-like glycosyltransferase